MTSPHTTGGVFQPSAIRRFFTFPNPVNEISARIVAAGVIVMAGLTIGLNQPWILIVIAYGFVARMLTGPTLSPLGQLSVRVLTPLIGREGRPVAGPPKRFAQALGVVFSVTAVVLSFGFGLRAAAYVVLGLLIVAAFLESALGLCLGCMAFGRLMRMGVIPEEVCQECDNIAQRTRATSIAELA